VYLLVPPWENFHTSWEAYYKSTRFFPPPSISITKDSHLKLRQILLLKGRVGPTCIHLFSSRTNFGYYSHFPCLRTNKYLLPWHYPTLPLYIRCLVFLSSHHLHMSRLMIRFASCFTMNKAHN